jgi:phosphate transport system permease protein
MSLEQLRTEIARRKRFDLLFGYGGGCLIFLSLFVLFALVANLVRDGTGALVQTHETKADKSGFGRREVVGTLQKSPDGHWLLKLDRVSITSAPEGTQELVGKRVAVQGRMPRGNDPRMEAESVTELPQGLPPRGLAGTLLVADSTDAAGADDSPAATDRPRFALEPEPIRLDVSNLSRDSIAALRDKARVSVDSDGKVRDGALTAGEVVGLVRKNFFTSFPSRTPREAGILSAWVGTMLIMLVTIMLAVPLGVAAGVYLEEYAPRNRLTAIIEVNIANLAGVPSIIWGLMALGLFVYLIGLGRSILTAGMTLGLLVLPIVIIATREAIRAIPQTIREAAVGLGATRWQTTRYHIIPYSMSGILTGSIIAMSRAIGETAPLVTIGALTFIAFLPPAPIERKVTDADRVSHRQAVEATPAGQSPPAPPAERLHLQPFAWLNSPFTVLPMQLFQWVSRPQKEFHANAAAAGVVLLVLTLGMNALAIYLRYHLRKKIKW